MSLMPYGKFIVKIQMVLCFKLLLKNSIQLKASIHYTPLHTRYEL